jgi:uncharacterized SAM-binding protein YcdF (DUF218 family)
VNSPQADLETVLQFLSVTDPPGPSDILFVFGGYHLTVPQKAAELYHLGLAPRIMVTGKDGSSARPDPDWTLPIAEVFRNHLLHAGVPNDAILVMPLSTNTLEDVLLGVPQLQDKISPLSTFTLVTRPVHQRRALATIRKVYPQYRYVCCPAGEHIPPLQENCTAGRELLERAIGEIDRLRRYGAKGDIEVHDIPTAVDTAYHRLVQRMAGH